jgi:hypothetical protein
MFRNIQTTFIGFSILGLIGYSIYTGASDGVVTALVGALTGIGLILSRDGNK